MVLWRRPANRTIIPVYYIIKDKPVVCPRSTAPQPILWNSQVIPDCRAAHGAVGRVLNLVVHEAIHLSASPQLILRAAKVVACGGRAAGSGGLNFVVCETAIGRAGPETILRDPEVVVGVCACTTSGDYVLDLVVGKTCGDGARPSSI